MFFSIFLIIGLSVSLSNGLSLYAKETIDDLSLIEKYSPDINDDFSNNKITVTLSKEYSDVNKMINVAEFETNSLISLENIEKNNLSENDIANKIIIKSIKDLTYMENPLIIIKPAEFRQILLFELVGNKKENILKAIEELENLSFVLAAEPLYNFSIEDDDEWLPLDDTDYDKQWGLHGDNGIQIEDAWNLIGNGKVNPIIRVGIFETNMQMDHLDLDTISGSFVPSTSASSQHGTHVAGIIGAIGDNGRGISGVAQVQIALLDRGPTGNLERTEFIDSLVWAIKNNIRIVNASFGFLYNGSNAPAQTAHVAAIQNFGNQGGVLICAAGNDHSNNDISAPFPAGYADSRNYPQITNVISVGAINENGARRNTSNYGINSVQIFAPGGVIYSTLPSNTYGNLSGTSMAAPHVTGVAALLLSVNQSLTVQQLRTAILQSAVPITITVPNPSGSGTVNQSAVRLNAYNAVKYVLEYYSNTQYNLGIYSTTTNATKTIVSGDSYFNNKNGFYKLNVTYAKTHEFNITSSNQVVVKLYDSNFTEEPITPTSIPNGKKVNIYLSTGTYYLRVYFQNPSQSGTITTEIVGLHTHNYGAPYLWRNYRQHFATCECGGRNLQGHAVSAGAFAGGNRYATCLLCGGSAEMGFVQWTRAINNPIITQNGSYILPNGVMVIVDDDLDAFLNGTLLFGTNGSYAFSYDDFMEQNTFSDILVISNNNVYYYKDESDTTPFMFDYSKKNQYQLDARN